MLHATGGECKEVNGLVYFPWNYRSMCILGVADVCQT